MWPLLITAADSHVPLKDKISYLTLVNHVHGLKIEDETQLQEIIEKIQELVSSPVTRHEGLLLMDAVQEKNERIYIPDWGNIVTGSLKCPDFYISRDITLKILSRNVRNFGGNPDYTLFFDGCMPGIVALLLQAKEKDVPRVCRVLSMCMDKIPDVLGPQADDIEKFLFKHLDCVSSETIAAMAHCFALLPLLFVKGRLTKGYDLAWKNLCTRTIVSLHCLLNEILYFPEVKISYLDVDSQNALELNAKHQGLVCISQMRIFKSLSHCLAKLISTNTNGVVMEVPISDILLCVKRIFSISEIAKVPEQIQKLQIFKISYPLLQHAGFAILEAIITNYNIIEQGNNFVQILQRSLEASRLTSLDASSKSGVRVTMWKLLNCWLNTYTSKGVYSIATDQNLLTEILKDIDILDIQTEDKSFDETTCASNSTLACSEALKALNNIILYGGSFVNKLILEKIFVTVLRVTQTMQVYFNTHGIFLTSFANEKCRKGFLGLLLSFCLHAEPQAKFVLQSINIFKPGLKDPSVKVKRLCYEAIKMCRFVFYARKPAPEATFQPRPSTNGPINVSECWNNAWNSNGHSQAENYTPISNLSAPLRIERAFTNAAVNNSQIDAGMEESLYSERDNDRHNNLNRTLSKNSSQSEEGGEDSGSEVEEARSSGEEDANDVEMESSPTFAPLVVVPQNVNSPLIDCLTMPSAVVKQTDQCLAENVSPEEILPHTPAENMESMSQEHDGRLGYVIPEKIPENGMDSDEESGEEEEEGDEDNYNENDNDDEEEDDEEEEVEDAGRKRSTEYDEEDDEDRVVKRQRIDEEEEVQSSDIEEFNNNEHLSEEEKVPDMETLSLNQKPSKILKENNEAIQNEEIQSNDGDKEEDTIVRDPSVKEMCQTFVLAEPAEIS